MKLRLKKDIVIKAGTVMDSDGVPRMTVRNASAAVAHYIAFGPNATGRLIVGHEVGDEAFDQWFEEVRG